VGGEAKEQVEVGAVGGGAHGRRLAGAHGVGLLLPTADGGHLDGGRRTELRVGGGTREDGAREGGASVDHLARHLGGEYHAAPGRADRRLRHGRRHGRREGRRRAGRLVWPLERTAHAGRASDKARLRTGCGGEDEGRREGLGQSGEGLIVARVGGASGRAESREEPIRVIRLLGSKLYRVGAAAAALSLEGDALAPEAGAAVAVGREIPLAGGLCAVALGARAAALLADDATLEGDEVHALAVL